jgi:two-component system KDP operon response regulator KdpE
MLPDMTGVDVCRELRLKHQTPIIILSIIGEEKTKVAALDEGADDYPTKPFGMDELLARVRVALRRGASDRTQQPTISAGGLTVDLERRQVTLDGRESTSPRPSTACSSTSRSTLARCSPTR